MSERSINYVEINLDNIVCTTSTVENGKVIHFRNKSESKAKRIYISFMDARFERAIEGSHMSLAIFKPLDNGPADFQTKLRNKAKTFLVENVIDLFGKKRTEATINKRLGNMFLDGDGNFSIPLDMGVYETISIPVFDEVSSHFDADKPRTDVTDESFEKIFMATTSKLIYIMPNITIENKDKIKTSIRPAQIQIQKRDGEEEYTPPEESSSSESDQE